MNFIWRSLFLISFAMTSYSSDVIQFGALKLDYKTFSDQPTYALYSILKDRVVVMKNDGDKGFVSANLRGWRTMPNSNLKPFSKVSLSGVRIFRVFQHPSHKSIFLWGSLTGNERINVFRVDEGSSSAQAITDYDYVPAFGFNKDGSRLYFTHRGSQEGTPGGLSVYDFKTKQTSKLLDLNGTWRVSWDGLQVSSNEMDIVFPVTPGIDRENSNIMHYNMQTKVAQVLLPAGLKNGMVEILDSDENTDRFATLFYVNGKSQTSLFKFSDLKTFKRISPENLDVSRGYQAMSYGGTAAAVLYSINRAIAISQSGVNSTLHLTDLNGRELQQLKVFGDVQVMSGEGSTVFVQVMHAGLPPELHRVDISASTMRLSPYVAYKKDDLKKMVYCNVEKVSYATFDGLKTPGDAQGIHAILWSPTVRNDQKHTLGIVEGFYGGDNLYSKSIHAACALGITTLSPSVRGSFSYGPAYRAKIEGDLDGGHIMDAIWGGQWLKERIKVSNSHIGVMGGSLGGYSSLRAINFPSQFNGIDIPFKFGFAKSIVGFGDIIKTFNDGSVAGEGRRLCGGDCRDNADKWNARSPTLTPQYNSGPVYLVHGKLDPRIPYSSSVEFYDSMIKAGKKSEILLLENEGHGNFSYKSTLQDLTKWYDFLEQNIAKQ